MQLTEATLLPVGASAQADLPDFDVPHVRIRPITQWTALDLGELWHFRELLTSLGIREVKLRYRQTALGAAWVVFQPLLAAGVFTIVFGLIAKMPSDNVPYFVFSYASMLGWTAFSNTLNKASTCLVGNASLISKVYFPRMILPFSTILPTLLDFVVAMAVMVVLMLWFHIWPGARILMLPFWIGLVLVLGLSIGLYAAALMVRYRDVQYVLPVMVQMGLYATPVMYPLAKVNELSPMLQHVYMLNPLCGVIEAFRWSLLGTGYLHWGALLYSTAFAVLSFVFATISFRSMERRFADVI